MAKRRTGVEIQKNTFTQNQKRLAIKHAMLAARRKRFEYLGPGISSGTY